MSGGFITPGLREAYMCSAEDLKQELNSSHVEASECCGAFTVHSGQDATGRVFFAIESHKGGGHVYIRTPFAADRWADAQESVR